MGNRSLLATIARVLIAIFFLGSGALKIFFFQPSAGLLGAIGFPTPQFFLIGMMVIEIGGGLCLLFGFGTRFVSVVLIAFMILASIFVHLPFIGDPVSGLDQMVHILKNIAIIGGLLRLVADGAISGLEGRERVRAD
jgi:putative oxidoreductase